MGLGSLVQKAAAGNGSLKKAISARFKETRVRLPLLKGGALRASAFADLCPREEVLCALGDITRKDEHDADTLLTFLHGTALHWAIQNRLLPTLRVLVGRWSCLGCGLVVGDQKNLPDGLVPRPEKCEKCGAGEFHYHELQLHNEEFNIGGHPDGFLIIPGLPGVGVLEAKSIGKGWSVRQCPQMSHVIQAHIYMWFTGLQWAKLLYWEKGGVGTEALIEHHVARDEETIQTIKATIQGIWKGIADGDLPERVCVNPTAPRAQKCCVAVPCFQKPVGVEL